MIGRRPRNGSPAVSDCGLRWSRSWRRLAMLPQVMSVSALRSEPAHAATSGITLRAGENLTLAGHAFTVTRTRTDMTMSGMPAVQ